MTSPRSDPTAWSPNSPDVLAWVERAMGDGARVVRVEPMPTSSTAKHRIEIALADGTTQSLVLRRYRDRARLASDPWYVPANEAHALELLAGTTVPAPRLFAADLEAEVCDVPALLESWVPGEPAWLADDASLWAAALVLVQIHATRPHDTARLPRYATYRGFEPVMAPQGSARPDLWLDVAAILDAPPPPYAEAFIHRDYHPWNVLWDGSRVSVVDWATAAWGPPGIDLARMRVNLAVHSSQANAEQFVLAYVNAGGDPSAFHPYWDLLDIADFVLDAALPEPDLTRLETHVEHALARYAWRTTDETHA